MNATYKQLIVLLSSLVPIVGCSNPVSETDAQVQANVGSTLLLVKCINGTHKDLTITATKVGAETYDITFNRAMTFISRELNPNNGGFGTGFVVFTPGQAQRATIQQKFATGASFHIPNGFYGSTDFIIQMNGPSLFLSVNKVGSPASGDGASVTSHSACSVSNLSNLD